MDKAQQLFKNYVEAVGAFIESVKNDIVHDGVVSDETINKMNAAQIAQNELADLQIPADFDSDIEVDTKTKH